MPLNQFGVNYGNAAQTKSLIAVILNQVSDVETQLNLAAGNFAGLNFASVDTDVALREIPILRERLNTLKRNLATLVVDAQQWESSFAGKWDALALGLNIEMTPTGPAFDGSFADLIDHLRYLETRELLGDAFVDAVTGLFRLLQLTLNPERRNQITEQIVNAFLSLPSDVLAAGVDFRSSPIFIPTPNVIYTFRFSISASLHDNTDRGREALRLSITRQMGEKPFPALSTSVPFGDSSLNARVSPEGLVVGASNRHGTVGINPLLALTGTASVTFSQQAFRNNYYSLFSSVNITARTPPRQRVPQRVPARQPEPLRIPEMPRFEPIYVTDQGFFERGWNVMRDWGRETRENLRDTRERAGEWVRGAGQAVGDGLSYVWNEYGGTVATVAACGLILASGKTFGLSGIVGLAILGSQTDWDDSSHDEMQ